MARATKRRNMAAETRTTALWREPSPPASIAPEALPINAAGRAGLPLSFEELMQLIEDLRGAGDAALVVAVRQGDAGDERGHAGGLLPPEGLFLQVDVVDDPADGADGLVGDAEAVAEDFESAALGVVGEVTPLHVESQGAGRRGRGAGGEPCLLVDEALDQPGAGHPVDVDAGACHPGAAAVVFRTQLARGNVVAFLEERRGRRSARRREKIDRLNGSKAPPESNTICALPPAPCALDLRDQRVVVSVPLILEALLHVGVSDPVDEARLEEVRLPSPLPDLRDRPLQVFRALLARRENVDRVLDLHRADPLEAPGHLDAEVARKSVV